MASEKVTEVEMEKISPAEEKESEDAEKGKVRETKVEEKEVEGKEKEKPEGKEDKKKEEEEEEEEEDPLYSNLNNPTEDVYSLAMLPGSPKKHQKDVYHKVTLYRRLCVILLIVCVVLLAVLLALAVKLSEARSSQRYRPTVESSTAPAVCSRLTCEALFPTLLASHLSGDTGEPQDNNHARLGCSECGKGWLKFDDSCYMLSRVRLSWQESRKECQNLGGDLVVIRDERVQRFLTNKGLMQYWIGLHRSENQEWTWVNNTALTTGYWAKNSQEGDCVFLNGGKWHKGNWHLSPCTRYSNYICQRG